MTRSTRRSSSSPPSRRSPRSSAGSAVCAASATLTALALTVELGDWTRFRPQCARPVSRPRPRARTRPVSGAGWARSPRPATHTPAGCWSRRPGSSGGRCARARRSRGAAQGQPAAVRARADQSARRLHQRWHALERRGKRRTSSRSPSHASSPATAGRSRPCSNAASNGSARRARRRNGREERPAVQL